MSNSLTITDLRNSNLNDLYLKLSLEKELTSNEIKAILQLALIFINEEDNNVKNFGYRILLRYSNIYQDYEALYDIAINSGLIPISKHITKITDRIIPNSFFNEFFSSFIETYKDEDIYLTEQQMNLNRFVNENKNNTISIVAPTSYGKSGIILTTIKNNLEAKTCIIVPSKALLEQTKKRILDAKIGIKKVVIHPEMYQKGNDSFVAVLTQERLLRLLKENKELCFDFVFIDEAHNLLEKNDRNVLLASAMTILNKRNSSLSFKFLTPFLMDSSNLKLDYTNYNPNEFRITEYIKSEKIFVYDFREGRENKLLFYDHFLNQFFDMNKKYNDDIDLILQCSKKKNIIYLNKPKDIEKFTKIFIQKLPEVKSEHLKQACKELKKHLHGDYNLIDALLHGVVYHHGSIPSYIRLYIEYLFKTEIELRYVVTSSTLLEGVNIPAEILFILDNRRGKIPLSSSQFKNLIGRVSRFSEVFSVESIDMEMLEPIIYIIGSKYFHSSWLPKNYLEKVMNVDRSVTDNPENPLLANVEINDTNKKTKIDADNFLENFEKNTIKSDNITYAKTLIGKLCFENNVTEIDVILQESEMQSIVNEYKQLNKKIDNTASLFDFMGKLFFPFIKDSDNYKNLARLSNEKARIFYKMFLDWKISSTSYNQMINSFLGYWKKLIDEKKDTLIYVDKWGDLKRGGFRELWVDIELKTTKERVNLAIVRIHDEQEFLDNVIAKYIDILNELELLNQGFYNLIKYGTNDVRKVLMIKNGISFSLAHLLIDHYADYVDISTENFYINNKVISKMQNNNENDILIFETQFNIVE